MKGRERGERERGEGGRREGRVKGRGEEREEREGGERGEGGRREERGERCEREGRGIKISQEKLALQGPQWSGAEGQIPVIEKKQLVYCLIMTIKTTLTTVVRSCSMTGYV